MATTISTTSSWTCVFRRDFTRRIAVFVLLVLLHSFLSALEQENRVNPVRNGASLPSGAWVMSGRQSARYKLIPEASGFRLPDYSNNGFTQSSQKKGSAFEVLVVVRTEPFGSREPARLVGPLGPELEPLRERLNREKQSLAEQVERLFSWVREHIEPESEYHADQSLERVLRSRSANCVGLTALVIHVLQQMGLEARYVTGVAFRNEDSVELLLEGIVLHRWLEIRYPDSGWIFADPAGLAHFVEAKYLVLGIEGLHPIRETLELAQGSRLELLSFKDGLRAVGLKPELDPRLRLRRN